MRDVARIRGRIVVTLFDAAGKVKSYQQGPNLITQIGDQYYGENAVGIGSPPAQPTCMKLGTDPTSPAKTGTGSALVAYLSNSNQAIDGSFPSSSLHSGAREISWQCTWGPGKATSTIPIYEVVLVNDTLADATSTSANTIARATISTVSAKQSTDTLVILWAHDLLGA